MTDKDSSSIRNHKSRIAFVSGVGENSWCIYADGFRRAAELLIENVTTTYEINTVIFPIIFLYRQYTELVLKEIIGYGQYLSQHHDVRQGGHDLNNLWLAAKSYIQKHCTEVDNDELTQVENIIFDLYKLDTTSEASRYPVIKQKSSSGKRSASFPYNAEPIDLDELAGRMRIGAAFLGKISSILSVCENLQREFQCEI